MFFKENWKFVVIATVLVIVRVSFPSVFAENIFLDIGLIAILFIGMFSLKTPSACEAYEDAREEIRKREEEVYDRRGSSNQESKQQDDEDSRVGVMQSPKEEEKRPPVFDFQNRDGIISVYLTSTKKPCAHGRVGGFGDKELISIVGKLDTRKLFNEDGKPDVKAFLSGIFKEDPRNPNRLILSRKFSDQLIKKDKRGKYTFAPLGSTTGKQINIRELIVYTLLAMKDRFDMQNVIEDLPFTPKNLQDFQDKFGEKYPDLTSFGNESFLDDICAFVNTKKFKENGFYVTDAMIVMPERAIETLNECLELYDYSLTSLFEWISNNLQFVVSCKQQIDGDRRAKEYQLICGFDSEIGMIVGEVKM